jgi:hypothetical protein
MTKFFYRGKMLFSGIILSKNITMQKDFREAAVNDYRKYRNRSKGSQNINVGICFPLLLSFIS